MRFLFLLSVLISLPIQGQDSEALKKFSLHTGFNFNGEDFFAGIGGGFQDLQHNWGAHFNIDVRPFYKKVLIDRDAQSKEQYFERKTLLSLGAEKRFLKIPAGKSNFRLLAGFQGGIMYGNYRGVKTSPEIDLLIQPYGGFSFDMGESGLVKAGYTWLDLNNERIPEGRFFLGFTFYLGEV